MFRTHSLFFFIFFFFFFIEFCNSQTNSIFFQNEFQKYRNKQITNSEYLNHSFLIRPFNFTYNLVLEDTLQENLDSLRTDYTKNNLKIKLLPIYTSARYSSVTALQTTDYFLPVVGFQNLTSIGGLFKLGKFNFQINPEFYYSPNKFFFTGSPKSFFTEYLERYGDKSFSKIFLGQSYLNFSFRSFAFGISNENIWWGPGQWNSLTFSSNSFGFKHLSLKTTKPISNFLGSFEAQLILGRLEGSNLPNYLSKFLFNDWRYLNGIIFTYQPKLIKGLFLGFSRTFQQYNSYKNNSFIDFFPIFNPFQKVKYGFDKDIEGRDQQATFFTRLLVPEANSEIYFEFGRRDHAINWREAFLNPEHARAYIFGFKNVILNNYNSVLVISGEIFHQQESINILIRYPGIGGGSNWGGHSPIFHGWTHKGQMINTGFGPGSNVQTLDFNFSKGLKNLGIKFDRVDRYQDFYIKNQHELLGINRWVDFRLSVNFSYNLKSLFINTNHTFVNSINHQWQSKSVSTLDFPLGNKIYSYHPQLSLIYYLDK